ncbi:MAG: hypothetical protein U0132_16470 [Gemmatimonadaceae bacterium]
MHGSIVRKAIPLVATFVAVACGNESSAPLNAAGTLAIQAPATVSAASFRTTGFEATVRNTGATTVFANVGDAFNSAVEQNPIYTSMGSDAIVEVESNPGTWSSITFSVMVEGTRYIALKPGKTYRLISMADVGAFRGQGRVRVQYNSSADGSGNAFVDYSNTFEIR